MFVRYAVYYAPPEQADWADFCTRWLGWDMVRGVPVAHPDLPDVARITETPRKYGLHATLKPPFRLAEGQDAAALDLACDALARHCAPVRLEGLELTSLGRFLALCPLGDTAALGRLAAACVETLDPFRAPPAPGELDRRRAAGLSPAQETMLTRWGYPHVMDQFRFHITLSGRLSPDDIAATRARLTDTLVPLLPQPFVIADLALAGEAEDGRFHLVKRYQLRG